jgi:hypothetical protein
LLCSDSGLPHDSFCFSVIFQFYFRFFVHF